MKAKSRILLIEDEPDLARSTQELLDHFGYDVHWSASVNDAFEEIVNDGYRAALLDLNLGKEDGVSLICTLRETGCDVPPLVILSAQPMERLREAAEKTGALAILQKPYTIKGLRKALQKAIDADVTV